MPLLFSKYATTFVRLMVSLVRNSTTTPAINRTTRPPATQPLRMRVIVLHPLVQAAAPHREREPRPGSAWESVSNPAPGAPARAAPAADRQAAGQATVLGRGSSRSGLAAASQADRTPDRRGCR